jgi:hypothetical protein
MFFLLSFMLFLPEKEGRTGSAWRLGWGVALIMYMHVSKCKNDKIK